MIKTNKRKTDVVAKFEVDKIGSGNNRVAGATEYLVVKIPLVA